jgi:hypothetical protein
MKLLSIFSQLFDHGSSREVLSVRVDLLEALLDHESVLDKLRRGIPSIISAKVAEKLAATLIVLNQVLFFSMPMQTCAEKVGNKR